MYDLLLTPPIWFAVNTGDAYDKILCYILTER